MEANARLTSSIAAVLLVLLAAEGLPVLRIFPLLKWHVFLGMLLVPPVAIKIGSTLYRFVRYYAGSPPNRRKGPPPPLLRLLGPFVVVLTGILFGSGIALLFDRSARGTLLSLHRASFILWFGAMVIDVLGHILESARLAPRDYYWKPVASSQALGCVSGESPQAWRSGRCSASCSSAGSVRSSPLESFIWSSGGSRMVR